MRRDYLLVAFMEEVRTGSSFTRATFPHHCTLMPWFSVPKRTLRKFERRLKGLAKVPHGRIELSMKGRDFFGPHRTVRCMTLKRTEKLTLLHTKAFAWLAEHGTLPKTLTWIGAGYRPHISLRSNELFSAMVRKCSAKKLSLVKREGRKYVVVRQFKFRHK